MLPHQVLSTMEWKKKRQQLAHLGRHRHNSEMRHKHQYDNISIYLNNQHNFFTRNQDHTNAIKCLLVLFETKKNTYIFKVSVCKYMQGSRPSPSASMATSPDSHVKMIKFRFRSYDPSMLPKSGYVNCNNVKIVQTHELDMMQCTYEQQFYLYESMCISFYIRRLLHNCDSTQKTRQLSSTYDKSARRLA